ncbi:MAG: hypothetical protein ABH827_00830 [bacterium]
MKVPKKLLLIMVLLQLISTTRVSARRFVAKKLNSANRSSGIDVRNGRMNITQPNQSLKTITITLPKAGSRTRFSADGTRLPDPVTGVSGEIVTLNDGILTQEGVALGVDKCDLDPEKETYIKFIGDTQIESNPSDSGFIFGTRSFSSRSPAVSRAETGVDISVTGSGNRVSGRFNPGQKIVFTDSSAELTIAIQNAYNENIELHGGLLTLGDDLKLTDDTFIEGPGDVNVAGYTLYLGGIYTSAWGTDITFQNARSITLNGNINVTGYWTFEDDSKINGNGAVLDLSGGGQLIIKPGVTLRLENITVKGLSNIDGKIVFQSGTSTLCLNGADVELSGDFTMNKGIVEVESDSTIALRTKNWNFDGLSVLRVNSRLNLYTFVFPISDASGQINAPLPLFLKHVLSVDNVNLDIASGNLEIGPDGFILEVADRSIGQSISDVTLVDTPITSDVLLDKGVTLAPVQTISVDADVAIDGRGSVITFIHQDTPQFIVHSGKKVILENIVFSRINAGTFRLDAGSEVYLGSNVLFEFDQDVTFTSGKFVIDGASNVVCMRGIGGKKKVTFKSPDRAKRFDLNYGSLVLQNIELEGVANFIGESDSSIALSGNSSVALDGDTSLNFDIEGSDNEIVIKQDALEYSGSIAFSGIAALNELTIRFSLYSLLADSSRRIGVLPGNPLFILTGDPGIYLTDSSDSGSSLAGLVFSDKSISIRNANSNAFITDANSFLQVQELEVLDYPIKQQSVDFDLISEKISGQGIDSSYVRMKKKGKAFVRRKSAFARMRSKNSFGLGALERDTQPVKKQDTPQDKKQDKKQTKKNIKKQKKNIATRSFDFDIERVLPEAPTSYDVIYRNELEINDPSGNLKFDGRASSRFKIGSIGFSSFDILADKANIFLPVQASLASGQVFRFSGENNIVNVTGLFEFGDANFDLQKSVIFQGLRVGSQDPMVRIKDNSVITLGQNMYFGATIPVELGDKAELKLVGQGPNISTIQFYDRGSLAPALGAQIIYLTGVGKALWNSGLLNAIEGNIYLNPNADDNITYVFDNASIRVADSKIIATGLGKSSWTLHDSSLLIEQNGTFAFNDVSSPAIRSPFGNQLKRGDFSQLIIDGNSYVHVGGKLVLGRNTIISDQVRLEKPFNIKWEPLNIDGDGLIEYVDRPAEEESYKGFVARVQRPVAKALIDSQMTFEKLAIFLSQKNTTFTQYGVLYYEQVSGTSCVRTNHGVTITLNSGDIPEVRENKKTNKIEIIVRSSKGELRAYDEDGKLI